MQYTHIEQELAEHDPRRNGMAAIATLLATKGKDLSAERSKEWGKNISEVELLSVLT